jgi:hypothetical protein
VLRLRSLLLTLNPKQAGTPKADADSRQKCYGNIYLAPTFPGLPHLTVPRSFTIVCLRCFFETLCSLTLPLLDNKCLPLAFTVSILLKSPSELAATIDGCTNSAMQKTRTAHPALISR